ncbi:tyrosine-protein phosphatase [Allonocardiopsis opalescens]|uniref:Protein-tyrosine phosphatase n=1 Tax=Allonocardiopsis opalescens TaxID=1144618 RepID=A0A2T0QDW9_9ACTN|nr:tyrosine-protein phosphatase [Allonocardiopsis opalescens]PRY02105.1 protein-tyrosine phosphatase [Allonocardiopsis opalescens]
MTVTEELDSRRHLPLAGTYNVRDVGGYPVLGGGRTRWRTLLRSDALHRLDGAGRAALADIGVRTVLDLREAVERDHAPDALDGLGARELHVPIFNDPPGRPAAFTPELAHLYRLLVDDCAPRLAAAVAALADADAFPAVVHCTAGKDRTGLVVAFALSVAGVPDDIVAADYQLTEQFLGEPFFAESRSRLLRYGVGEDEMETLRSIHLDAPAQLLLEVLTRMRAEHGDVAGYLRGNGVTDAQIEVLRTALVEPA